MDSQLVLCEVEVFGRYLGGSSNVQPNRDVVGYHQKDKKKHKKTKKVHDAIFVVLPTAFMAVLATGTLFYVLVLKKKSPEDEEEGADETENAPGNATNNAPGNSTNNAAENADNTLGNVAVTAGKFN